MNTEERMRKVEQVMALVTATLWKAYAKFPRVAGSYHESYAVLLEEMDELWAEIKVGVQRDNQGDLSGAEGEALHVAAMAVRLIVDGEMREG